MTTPKPDPNKSRAYPRTYKGIEWASILTLLKRGLEVSGEDREADIVKNLLPDLQKTVGVLADLEPLGCGLDHPDWKRGGKKRS